jgi:hypothetical protein
MKPPRNGRRWSMMAAVTRSPTRGRARYFAGCVLPPESEDLAQARKILAGFAERAFRRPVQEAEAERWVNLVSSEWRDKNFHSNEIGCTPFIAILFDALTSGLHDARPL